MKKKTGQTFMNSFHIVCPVFQVYLLYPKSKLIFLCLVYNYVHFSLNDGS